MAEKMRAFTFDLIEMSDGAGITMSDNGYIPVTSGSVFYTAPFTVSDSTFAFMYKATSDGNVAAKIELEQGFTAPTTAGSADANWVVPDSATEFDDSLTDELVHIKAYPPCAAPFARFKITGLAGVDATTELTVLKGSFIQ